MDKRTFLKLSFSSASFVVLGGVGALLSPQKKRKTFSSSTSTKRLSQGESYEVRSGEILGLPKSPRRGDFVHIKVSKQGLTGSRNCRITYENDRLLGLAEDLELDVLSNIKLVYKGASKGWHFNA